MKKKNETGGGNRILALWEKASKEKKIDETSTPNQTVAASGICTSHVQLGSNLQLALVQAPDAEHEPESREATPTPIDKDVETSVDYLNNCLVTFVEREFFNQVKDEDIINLFQKVDRTVIL